MRMNIDIPIDVLIIFIVSFCSGPLRCDIEADFLIVAFDMMTS